MRAIAEMNLAQTREAYEHSKNALEAALETLGRSFDAVGQGATALNHRIIDIAHRNIGSSFDLAKSLAGKEPLVAQAEEVRSLSTQVIADVAQPTKD